MPGFATLRRTWEPRMLSILRIMVGLLYMEHGLAKILDFPHQQTHAPYALFTLNPGLQEAPPAVLIRKFTLLVLVTRRMSA
jgi:uncharacterized membrane protein YphA (DoxX/SURF4 family)